MLIQGKFSRIMHIIYIYREKDKLVHLSAVVALQALDAKYLPNSENIILAPNVIYYVNEQCLDQ